MPAQSKHPMKSDFTGKSDAPVYVVFAGVNGTGKSTLFHSKAWQQPHIPSNMARVNPDEIAARSAAPMSDFQAGKIAVERIESLFARKTSFNQETTLSSRSSLRNIKRAYELGYRVILFYIGVQNSEVALSRIAHRVSVGGHDIDPATVKRRRNASLRNLSHALPYCEEAHIIDNTIDFHTLARWKHGVIEWWDHPKVHGPWLLEAMQDESIWKASDTCG